MDKEEIRELVWNKLERIIKIQQSLMEIANINAGIDTAIDIVNNRLDLMAKKSIEDAHERLYPKNLGEAAKVRVPEVRLVVIAEYEGYGRALQELGIDTKQLESILEYETTKTIEGK